MSVVFPCKTDIDTTYKIVKHYRGLDRRTVKKKKEDKKILLQKELVGYGLIRRKRNQMMEDSTI